MHEIPSRTIITRAVSLTASGLRRRLPPLGLFSHRTAPGGSGAPLRLPAVPSCIPCIPGTGAGMASEGLEERFLARLLLLGEEDKSFLSLITPV